MTDDEIDKLHDNIDCWSGYGLGARFDHRAFARKVAAAERERCAAVCEGVREAADHAARDGHRKAGAMASAALCAKLIRA